jgi:hypothetical protein
MIKKFVGLIVLVALSGCAAVYTYNGQKYDSKEKFQQAVDSTASGALSTITPLPTPLTQRKLLFAVPSEIALFNENVRRFVEVNNRQPNALQNEMAQTLSGGAFTNLKSYFDAVQKRNIFASTQFVEMQSMTASFAASADTDTLYLIEPAAGSNQWYYTSLKHGKQIFSFDRGTPTPASKLQSFIDAVQAQAVRD